MPPRIGQAPRSSGPESRLSKVGPTPIQTMLQAASAQAMPSAAVTQTVAAVVGFSTS